MAGQESRRTLVGTRLVEEPGGLDERTVPYTDLEVWRLVEAVRGLLDGDYSNESWLTLRTTAAPFPQWETRQ